MTTEQPTQRFIAAGMVACLLVIGGVVLYLLDWRPRPNIVPPLPGMEQESQADAKRVLDGLAKELHGAGRTFQKDISELLGSAPGREHLFLEGQSLESSGNHALAAKLYRRLARAGHGKSAKRLGEIYGQGVPGIQRDTGDSLQWYERARELGEPLELCCRR